MIKKQKTKQSYHIIYIHAWSPWLPEGWVLSSWASSSNWWPQTTEHITFTTKQSVWIFLNFFFSFSDHILSFSQLVWLACLKDLGICGLGLSAGHWNFLPLFSILPLNFPCWHVKFACASHLYFFEHLHGWHTKPRLGTWSCHHALVYGYLATSVSPAFLILSSPFPAIFPVSKAWNFATKSVNQRFCWIKIMVKLNLTLLWLFRHGFWWLSRWLSHGDGCTHDSHKYAVMLYWPDDFCEKCFKFLSN